MRHKFIFVFFIAFLPLFIYGQEIPIGTWRSHLNYSGARLVALYQNKVFTASEFGFFYFDLEDNSLNRLTKSDGLSDVGITALAAIPQSQGLIIGYKSGQIDILEDNVLTNIGTIKYSSIATDKAINHIAFYNNLAYLSTDFGLVALDYQKKEIKESYNQIGVEGASLSVVSSAIHHDSIFLSTSEGIIATAFNATNNLLDYNNWHRLTIAEGLNTSAPFTLATFNNTLYIGIDEGGIYQYNNYQWQKIDFPATATFVRMRSEGPFLHIITKEKIYQVSAEHDITVIAANTLKAPSDIVLTTTGSFYIADQQLGLVTNRNGNFENFYPNGPLPAHLNKLYYFDGKIAALKKGFDENFNALNKPAAFNIFHEGTWESQSIQNIAALGDIKDISDIAYSKRSGLLYLGTFGHGAFTWNPADNTFAPLTQHSPLLSSKITAITSSENGHILFSEHKNAAILHVLEENKSTWTTYPLATNEPVLAILNPLFETLWLRLSKNMLAYNLTSGASTLLTKSNNNLIEDRVTTFGYDENDIIWYGTPNGIAYIPNPWEALDGAARSIVPVFENSALFRNEQIDVLAIDGANRKWIATKDGLWIFGADGDHLIAHFTEDNSPLLSNRIKDIAINAITGEAFIATDKGLVSFRSPTSKGASTHQQVKIFPNPVRQGFNGQIGISGLVEHAIVKITDVSGNLVREIRSMGGTATWDGNSLSGSRVNTGIYLVFSASEDGTESFVGKLAFIK